LDYTSHDVQEALGDVAVEMGHAIDLDDPDIPVYVEATHERAYVYTEKHAGLGGLPVGTAGKVLCLLSGGIDSPVAAWYMMKRGCHVDYVHFNPYATAEAALNEKFAYVLETLNRYQQGCDVYFAPYGVYQLEATVDPEYDLVAFRNCMTRTAERLAEEHGYEAIVTGDSVAQVASQTLQNLSAVNVGVKMPIFRPLLGFDKEEVIDRARMIGTYEDSIREYKDCCSIIADSPNTGVSREDMREVLQDEDMDGIVDGTVEEIEHVHVEVCMSSVEQWFPWPFHVFLDE
ncbi:MAG: tRNA sulfurtransferase, partial [Halobacteriaceae archaeon]